MSDETPKNELTREELYEKVWSTPGTKLAEELGISDVAITKRCKKLNVPRPSRGYWAKLAAGMKPRRVRLPPEPKQLATLTLEDPVPDVLPLPRGKVHLHPVAVELMSALPATESSYDGMCRSESRLLPKVHVSKAMISHAARCLHVLIMAMQVRGVSFENTRSKYDPARFKWGDHELLIKIEEPTVLEDLLSRRVSGAFSDHWEARKKKPSGKLTFSFDEDRYHRHYDSRELRKLTWTEENQGTTEQILAKIVKASCEHFIKLEQERIAREERWRKEEEERLAEEIVERKRKHEAAIEETIHVRAEDLLKASEWWRLWREADAFIQECERRWRDTQNGKLTKEQEGWLAWARETAIGMSPFETGYPDPARDGAFNREEIPEGGPYPSKRDFPRPPTMPKIPPPVVQQSGYGYSSTPAPAPSPYPFWLKYQGR